jgi:hypothetical protein
MLIYNDKLNEGDSPKRNVKNGETQKIKQKIKGIGFFSIQFLFNNNEINRIPEISQLKLIPAIVIHWRTIVSVGKRNMHFSLVFPFEISIITLS